MNYPPVRLLLILLISGGIFWLLKQEAPQDSQAPQQKAPLQQAPLQQAPLQQVQETKATSRPTPPLLSLPTYPNPVSSMLQGNLYVYNSGRRKMYDFNRLRTVKYYALYDSAHWCPGCREFTPKLVEFYNRNKAAHPEFEVIFFSSDDTEADMSHYMQSAGMQWPAVGFKNGGTLKRYFGKSIPCLVLIDEKGQVLADTFVNGQYTGPSNVLKAMQRLMHVQ